MQSFLKRSIDDRRSLEGSGIIEIDQAYLDTMQSMGDIDKTYLQSINVGYLVKDSELDSVQITSGSIDVGEAGNLDTSYLGSNAIIIEQAGDRDAFKRLIGNVAYKSQIQPTHRTI